MWAAQSYGVGKDIAGDPRPNKNKKNTDALPFHRLRRVGFEPTRSKEQRILSAPPLTTREYWCWSRSLLETLRFTIGTNPHFRVSQQGSNLHPVINSDCLLL